MQSHIFSKNLYLWGLFHTSGNIGTNDLGTYGCIAEYYKSSGDTIKSGGCTKVYAGSATYPPTTNFFLEMGRGNHHINSLCQQYFSYFSL